MRGEDPLLSPIRLAAASTNPGWQQLTDLSNGHQSRRKESQRAQQQHPAREHPHAGRQILQDLAECVAVQEQMRSMLEAGKRNGEAALLTRSDEINAQMEAAIALQKALLSSVEALSQDMMCLRVKLHESETLCSEAETDCVALRNRLHVVHLAGARQVVKLLRQVAFRVQAWTFLRWHQVLCSENSRRNSFLHLKKIAMKRFCVGTKGLNNIWQQWRGECQQMNAVSKYVSAYGDVKRRTTTERLGFRLWKDSTLHAVSRRRQARKLIMRNVRKHVSAWRKYHDTKKSERGMLRLAVTKMMRRSLLCMWACWVHEASRKKDSRDYLISTTLMRDKESLGTILKHHYQSWRQFCSDKQYYVSLIAQCSTPRLVRQNLWMRLWTYVRTSNLSASCDVVCLVPCDAGEAQADMSRSHDSNFHYAQGNYQGCGQNVRLCHGNLLWNCSSLYRRSTLPYLLHFHLVPLDIATAHDISHRNIASINASIILFFLMTALQGNSGHVFQHGRRAASMSPGRVKSSSEWGSSRGSHTRNAVPSYPSASSDP